ncbi:MULTISPECIES: TolC family protein [Marinobacter]|uniref:TolC family protein n=1 Tax=Marinobacter metalliresistant TaxID=2961995 RepID=A0ABZ2W6E8_9GAMM|nr:TolC family protein [Marinobacter sp. Arc7-DN-1]AXS83056.1 TolC family protein [Marinobacter sp. Arc7-DN-1]
MRRFDWPWQALLSACVLVLPLLAHAQTSGWDAWLASQVQQHPDVLAAREQWLGSNASADAVEQPIYNPELSTDLERNGDDDNYRVGVQQTIDWWDRRGARRQQAGYLRSAAEALYRQRVLDKTAEAVAALVEWQSASRAAAISQAQQEQLNTLLELVEKRQQAGDLGSIDAELTFLSLSQQLAQVAEVEATLQRAETRVRELLPRWTPERGGIPDDFWPSTPGPVPDRELLGHPAVASAHARWQSLKEEAEVTRRSARAEPTVGLNAGRDEGESVVGLTFSIPLNVRNNFRFETRTAERAALEAEARFQAVYRKQRFDWQAAYAAWQRYEQQYRRWQDVVRGRVENSAELLERQWRSGDLSTTDYLLALNQRAESLRSGIELATQTRLALTEVLQQSGRLMRATMPATAPTNE